MDELDGADVEAARGLGGHEDGRVTRHLARDDDLLLVAARERRRERRRPPTPNVELAQQTDRALDEPPRVQPAEARRRLLLEIVQREVLGEREVQHEPTPLPVLGDMADSLVEHRPRARAGDVLAAEEDAPSRGAPEPRQGVDELRLAVAVDSRDADDLASSDLERDVAHLLELSARREP